MKHTVESLVLCVRSISLYFLLVVLGVWILDSDKVVPYKYNVQQCPLRTLPLNLIKILDLKKLLESDKRHIDFLT